MPGRASANEPPGASRAAGCCSGGRLYGLWSREYGDCGRYPAGEAIPVYDRRLLVCGEFAFKAAKAPARVPSCERREELSGEWMRKPTGDSAGGAPYWDSNCVLRFWNLVMAKGQNVSGGTLVTMYMISGVETV